MAEVIYDCRWTNNINPEFIKDWQFVENTVFGGFDDQFIKRKYLENIYGPSLLVVAYLDGRPVGADALWRNDINNREAYQSSDTCVLLSARGKGIMTGFTKIELAKAPHGCYIYGSPNAYSYPGYRKMHWAEIEMYPAIFFSSKRYSEEYPVFLPKEYAEWWIVGSNKYHIKIGSHYYLVAKFAGSRRCFVHLIAEVNEATAMMYPRYKKLALFIYRTYKRPFLKLFRRHPYHHISWQGDPSLFPYWKIDGYAE